MINLVLWELNKLRGGIIVWGIGLGVYLALVLWLAPDLAPRFAAVDLSENEVYRAFGIGQNVGTAEKLLAVYIPFIGLLMGVYGALVGSHALVGEKRDGTLETLLTLPISRPMIVIAKTVALELAILFILAFTLAVALAPMLITNSTLITPTKLMLVCLEPFGLAVLMGMFTLCLSSFVSRRSHALTAGLLLLIGSYLFNNLIGDWFRWHPFHHYSGGAILTEPFPIVSFVGMLLIGVLFCVGTIFLFERRDLMAGQTLQGR